MSCCGTTQDFCVAAGATFAPTIRWASDITVSVPISAITQQAGAVVTAAGHGLPNGWPCAVVSAQGMPQINATRYPPQGNDWKRSVVVSASQVQLIDVNSADFTPYTSGGFLAYSTPQDLTGVTATLTIYAAPDHTGTPLATLSSTGGTIALDNTAKTIKPQLQTAGLTWNTGYYTLDVADSGGKVTEVMRGTIVINE